MSMRTTITFNDDVYAALERHRRDRDVGISEVVNELVRAGLSGRPKRKKFVQRTDDLGEGIDFANVWQAIDALESPLER